jgi:hypothetical protein
METVIGLFKTECIRTTVFHTGPYKTWRASPIPDSGPNKVRPGMEEWKCQNGARSSPLSLRTRR